ncbi:MAG: serine/threonine protein kinase [Planctomycetes bacterium]|nr:serine/threonine protein kinase [Planctomycetota bacterium]
MPEADRPADNASQGCPSLEVLEAIVSGRAGHVRASDSSHALSCPRCLQRLDTIRKNNDLLSRLESVGSVDGGGSVVAGSPGTRAHGEQAQGSAAASRWAEEAGPAAGRLLEIDGYEIGEEIHRGGQGVVYRARQVATNREVAVKVLLAGTFATERQRLRFEREIELAAALRHPNIVTVHDSGRTADGSEYLVMEYVRGQPLDAYARHVSDYGATAPKSRARVCELLALFEQVCRAVTYAHQHGVIHRDLKPANILVDVDGAPHVLDFGLAKALESTASHDGGGNTPGIHDTLTMPDSFLGTLAYAAPEQVRGDSAAIDVRTDVYAIGVMLYEALTGSLPFAMNQPLPDVLHAIAESAPASMARHASFLIDTELRTIVLKALSKEKGRRYQSADAFRADISHYIAGDPIDARRDSSFYLLGKTLKRYRWLAGGGTAAVVVLTIFAIAMSILWQRARVEAAKSNQIRIFLEDTLGSVQPTVPGRPVTVRETLDEAVHWVDIALEGQPEVQASLLMTIGNSYRSLGHYEAAGRHIERALAILEHVHGDRRNLSVAQALNALGLLRRDEGRFAEAESIFLEVLKIRKQQLGPNHLDVAMCMSNLGQLRVLMKDYLKAGDWYGQAYDIRTDVLGYENADVAMTLYQMGEISRLSRDLRMALVLHGQSLSIRQSVLHEEHPDLARSFLATGLLMLASGEYDEAEVQLREALRVRQRILPADHWLIAETEMELGEFLVYQGGAVHEGSVLLGHAYGVLYVAFGGTDERTQRALRGLLHAYREMWNVKFNM